MPFVLSLVTAWSRHARRSLVLQLQPRLLVHPPYLQPRHQAASIRLALRLLSTSLSKLSLLEARRFVSPTPGAPARTISTGALFQVILAMPVYWPRKTSNARPTRRTNSLSLPLPAQKPTRPCLQQSPARFTCHVIHARPPLCAVQLLHRVQPLERTWWVSHP